MNLRRATRKLVPPSVLSGQSLVRAMTAQTVSGLPARKLKVIGVTGTDGKSTTCLLIASMLRSAGLKTALLSTVSVDLADGQGMRPSPKHMTTAGNWDLARFLRKIRRNKAEWLVMEVSSHALDQHRVLGIPFSVAVFTNLSHEHLDYHGTMDNYRNAKLKLFTITNRNKKGLQAGVINADDPAASAFLSAVKNPLSYGIKRGELKAGALRADSKGTSFSAKIGGDTYRLRCWLPGRFNVYNALAAAGVGRVLGLTPEQIEKGIAGLKSVPGRMTPVVAGQSFKVFVDYAVTPSALEQALAAAHEIAGKSRVLLVFGATGDRDKAKRPGMGWVAGMGADQIFLTDDETYTEDPETIRQAVYRGIERAKASSKTKTMPDRREAIATALETARTGDVVLVTGLGHQTSRNMGGHDEPWDDAEVIGQLLKK